MKSELIELEMNLAENRLVYAAMQRGGRAPDLMRLADKVHAALLKLRKSRNARKWQAVLEVYKI